jgi:hypothetical protein
MWIVLAGVAIVAGAGPWLAQRQRAARGLKPQDLLRTPDQQARDSLFAELQPVKLANCELERFGEKHDGGYLLCTNLLASVKSAYSYGISGYDGWGCAVSTRLKVRTHQYDCFDPTQPACPGGDTLFHSECIGPDATTDKERRPFDTLEHQVVKNGDAGKYLVVKMDVEGAEWRSLMQTPDDVLERIDQIAIELHDFGRDFGRFVGVVSRLKQFFHVAHLHFNNYSCMKGLEPFPAQAYEVLFVSKRIAKLDGPGIPARPHPLDAPNNPALPDCQFAEPARSEIPPRASTGEDGR